MTKLLVNDIKSEYLTYFISNLLNIVFNYDRICEINYDLIPKLIAYEDNSLYINFLNEIKSDEDCITNYNKCTTEYNEFLFISLSFLHRINQKTPPLVIHNDTSNQKLKIFSDKLKTFIREENINLNDNELTGNIQFNIQTH